MNCEPSDSDDEPLDFNIRKQNRAQSSWVNWSKSNANEALGAGHQREMNENFGIAKNKRQQLNEELSLINRRRQHSNSRAESSEEETGGFPFSSLNRHKKKKQKTIVPAQLLKSENRSSDSETEITVKSEPLKTDRKKSRKKKRSKNSTPITIEDSPIVSRKSTHSPKNFRRTKDTSNIPNHSSDFLSEKNRKILENRKVLENGKNSEISSEKVPLKDTPARHKQHEREVRKHEQILKNKSRLKKLESDRSELATKLSEIEIDIEKEILRLENLKIERNKVEEELKKKDLSISTLQKLTGRLEKNGFETPKKKETVLTISSDEDKNGPIWEMPGYN